MMCNVAGTLPVDCKHYKSRYYCLLGVSTVISTTASPTVKSTVAPTPEGTTTTPSPALVTTEASRPCENKTFWSPWVDKHNPNTYEGESEFMTVQEIQAFSPYGIISSIKCTQQDGTEFTATGEISTCTIAEGFVCDGPANAPFPCNDYRVRYQCKEICLVTTVPPSTASPTLKTTEAPPTTVSSTTATPTPGTTEASPQLCTTSHWGSWINRDKPDIGGSDHEFLTPYKLKRFCYGGQVSKIECVVDSENNIPYYSSGEDVGYCDKERGFICNNADNFPVQCSDYKIRYYYNCSNPTEPINSASETPDKFMTLLASPTTGDQGSPTPSSTSVGQGTQTVKPTTLQQDYPTVQPPVCVTRWSTWIDRNNSENNDGDYESLTPEELKKFCPGGTIKKVECQTTDGIPDYSTGVIQTCTPEKGLVCNNDENFPVGCDNYEIRYYCLCASIDAYPTGTPGTNLLVCSPSDS